MHFVPVNCISTESADLTSVLKRAYDDAGDMNAQQQAPTEAVRGAAMAPTQMALRLTAGQMRSSILRLRGGSITRENLKRGFASSPLRHKDVAAQNEKPNLRHAQRPRTSSRPSDR